MARNASGGVCSSHSGDATQWCLRGAINRAANLDMRLIDLAVGVLVKLCGCPLAGFNDAHMRRHDEIIELLDLAIVSCH